MNNMIQIDKETAKDVLTLLTDAPIGPTRWDALKAVVTREIRSALDAPQAQPDPKLAAILDSKWRAGVKPDEILGAWAEDFSTYKIIAPPQLREQLLALQHRAIDALDAPQTTEAIDPDNSRCAIPPPAQPDPREAFEAWWGNSQSTVTEYADFGDKAIARLAFEAGFAAGRGR